jgi:hypothetical protein
MSEKQSSQKKTQEAKKSPVELPQAAGQELAGEAALSFSQPGTLADFPNTSNSNRLRQSALLKMQQKQGNQTVQRSLANQLIQRQGGSAGGGNTTPIPKLPELEARKNLAVHILKKAYASRIKTEAKVVGKESEDAIRTEYDQAMIRQGKKFREKGAEGEEDKLRDWESGDSAKHPDLQDAGTFKGFNDPSSGQVFLDTSKEPDDQVATIVHEQLHANAAPDFPGTLGKQVDEGMTEKLTQNAFTISGYTAPSGQYESEVSFVNDLGSMVGEGVMVSAYFGGVGALRSMLNAQTDDNTFDKFAQAARTKDWNWMKKFFEEYFEKLRSGSELDKKIAAINLALDGWVTDEDIDNIRGIVASATAEEKSQLRSVIQARIGDLVDIGQRTQLRVIVAS